MRRGRRHDPPHRFVFRPVSPNGEPRGSIRPDINFSGTEGFRESHRSRNSLAGHTLLLAAGEPVHVVSERLGHRDATVTLTVYARVLKTHQQGAADRISALLHGLG